MASIIYDQFGGIIPKLDPRNLPPGAAQKAHNVELSGGKLAPIDMTGGFFVSHDPDTGLMKGQIPDGDIISISEPVTPVVAERIKLLRPAAPGLPLGDGFSWQFTVAMYVTYFDENGDFQTDDVSPSWDLTKGAWDYTDDGIIWRGYLFQKTFSATPGLVYTVHGPKFKIEFFEDDKYYGGPDQDYAFPEGSLSRSSPDYPDFSMPLTAPIDYSGYDDTPGDGGSVYTGQRYTYGHLQLASVNNPIAEPIIDLSTNEATGPITVTLTEAGYAEFIFKANYQRSRQQFVLYAASAVDQRVAEGSANAGYSGGVTSIFVKEMRYGLTDIPVTGKLRLVNSAGQQDDIAYTAFSVTNGVYEFTVSATLTYVYLEDDNVIVIDETTVGKEGPPSELTDQIVVDAGDVLKLTLTRPTGYNRQKLYRSGGDGNFYVLEDELEADSYIDTFIESLGEALPPYGNFPQATVEEARAESIVIGGHTAITFDGDEVRPADPYRPWVYPDEYAFNLNAPFLAAVAFGSSAIIWTDTHPVTSEVGKVLQYSGQHPMHKSLFELSTDKPLLNKRSVAVIDQVAYYVSNDGVIAVSGGSVRNITEQFFNREDWEAENPQFYSAYTRDTSLFLIHLNNGNHYRIDLNDGNAYLTTFDGFNGGQLCWLGKKEESHRPIAFKVAQIIADNYPVEMKLKGDNGYVEYSVLLPNDNAKLLPRMRKCKTWEIELNSLYQVNRAAIATNVQELNR